MATAVTCPECGADAPAGTARWCGSCGAALTDPSQAATTPGTATSVLRLTDDAPVIVQEPPLPRGQRGAALLAIAAVVLGMLALQARGGDSGASTALTPRGDAARSGVVSTASPGAPTDIAWRAPVVGDGGWTRQHLAVSGERVAVAGRDGVSLHTRDGRLLWHRPDIAGSATPAVAGDVVVVFDHAPPSRGGLRDGEIAQRGRLRGLAVDDGATVWSTQLQFGPPTLTQHPAGLLLRDGTRGIALIDPATGREEWRMDAFATFDASVRDVLVGDVEEVVHLLATRPAGLDPQSAPPGALTESLVALDAATGAIRFEVAPILQSDATNPFALSGDTVVGLGSGSLLTWDAVSGQPAAEVVRHNLVTEIERLVAHDDLLVAVYSTGTVLALDPSDLSRVWAVRNPVGNVDDAFVSGDTLVLRAGDRLATVELDTGDTITTLDLPLGAAVSPPDTDGSYAALGSGRLELRDAEHDVETEWRTITPAWPAPTVAADAVAVVTARETALFDLESGENRWRLATSGADRRTPTGSIGAPVVADDLLVFSPPRDENDVAKDGLAGVDLVQAVFRWDRSEDEPPPTGPLTLATGTVYVPVGDEIHGYAVPTGRRSFAARAGHGRGPVALHSEYVVAASDPRVIADDPRIGPSLAAIRRADRSPAWEQPVEACTPPVVSGDLVLVGTVDGISAHDIHRGGRQWLAPLPEPGCIDLAVARDTIVATPGLDTLAAFSTSGGDPLWTRALADAVTAPPTVAGDIVIVALRDGTIVALDLATGELRWRYELGAVPVSSVSVGGGHLLVLTDAGELVAIATS